MWPRQSDVSGSDGVSGLRNPIQYFFSLRWHRSEFTWHPLQPKSLSCRETGSLTPQAIGLDCEPHSAVDCLPGHSASSILQYFELVRTNLCNADKSEPQVDKSCPSRKHSGRRRQGTAQWRGLHPTTHWSSHLRDTKTTSEHYFYAVECN